MLTADIGPDISARLCIPDSHLLITQVPVECRQWHQFDEVRDFRILDYRLYVDGDHVEAAVECAHERGERRLYDIWCTMYQPSG